MLLSVKIHEAGYTKGSRTLNDINFSVNRGELVGMIGPNGAGKSTIIKAILGILEHVNGSVQVSEYAYIPERPIFYERLTLWEHIDFLISTMEGDCGEFEKKARELLEYFQLANVIHDFPETFSKGMQQKVMLILAFLKSPDLYIIDEPFMGLDPKAIKKLLKLLNNEMERGAGILMSTHALDTAEKICDRFVLVSNGNLLIEGKLDEIRRESGLASGSLFDCFDYLTEREENVR